MQISSFDKVRNFSDTIHETVVYNGFEEIVISTPLLHRLHRISQNSLVYLTFPSNRVKRFEHSMGVMHLASEFFRHALINTNKARVTEFFNNFNKYLSEWVKNYRRKNETNVAIHYPDSIFSDDRNGLPAIEKSPKTLSEKLKDNKFFNMLFPSNINKSQYFVCAAVFQGLRLAGLLHDVGHLPYSHTLESILDQLYSSITVSVNSNELSDNIEDKLGKRTTGKQTKRKEFNLTNNFTDLFSDYRESGQAIHEQISKEMLDVVEIEVADKIKEIAKNDPKADYYSLLCYVSFKIARDLMYNKDSLPYEYLHSIISGTIDADRLDYASRDLFSSAVTKDILNYKRLFLHAALHKSNGQFLIAFDVKAIRDIEGFLQARWRSYRDINYHHSVHKSELFMRRILLKQSKLALAKSPKDFDAYKKDCESDPKRTKLPVDNFIVGIMLILYYLIKERNNEKLSKALLSLDDSWLDTVMKNSDDGSDDENELLAGRKKYKTILKRYSDFWDFDFKVFKLYKKLLKPYRHKLLDAYITNLQSLTDEDDNTIGDASDVAFLLGAIDYTPNGNLKNELMFESFLVDNRNILFTKKIIELLELVYYKSSKYSDKIKPMDDFIDKASCMSGDFYENIFIGAIDINTGFKTRKFPNFDKLTEYTYVLWHENKKEIVDIKKYSTISQDLENEKELLQPFHLYAKNEIANGECIDKIAQDFYDFSSPIVEEFIKDFIDSNKSEDEK
jgi:HD superfamily phosphohydrolase